MRNKKKEAKLPLDEYFCFCFCSQESDLSVFNALLRYVNVIIFSIFVIGLVKWCASSS